MGMPVTTGCQAMCSFGLAPGAVSATPGTMAMVGGRPALTIMDHVPMLNVSAFGMCSSLANPMVAAATAAALGVLTPQPCLPVLPAPWIPGAPTVLVGGKPALTMSSSCVCAYGGMLKVITPGAPTVTLPG